MHPIKSLISDGISLVVILLMIALLVNHQQGVTARSANNTLIRNRLNEFEDCILGATFSFSDPKHFPPTSVDQLKETCENQAKSFKCLKEKTKSSPALIKRGVAVLVQTRQKHAKKFCANVNSEQSKRFLQDMKCIFDKKPKVMQGIDSLYVNNVREIDRKVFPNAAEEMKFYCCNILNYKRSILEAVNPECADSKANFEEMMNTIVPSEINFICDDELPIKVCPKIEPLTKSRVYVPSPPGDGIGSLSLYMAATLGDPEA